MTIFVITAGKF